MEKWLHDIEARSTSSWIMHQTTYAQGLGTTIAFLHKDNENYSRVQLKTVYTYRIQYIESEFSFSI